MLRSKLARGAFALIGVLAAGALVAVGVALWPGQAAAPPVAAAGTPGGPSPPAEAPGPAHPPRPPEAVGEEAVEAAAAELPVVCAALDEDQHLLPTRACLDALEAHFLPMPASRTILPVSPPLDWSDVFHDLVEKIETVDAALADAACDVPEGEIRPERGAACAARTMAELGVLRKTCLPPNPHVADPHFSLSAKSFDLGAMDVMVWDRVHRTSYGTDVDAKNRERLLGEWAEHAPDQAAWAAGKRRIDDLYYRTAWKRARCQASAPMLDWVRGERWDGLLARAARLGDAFALAHHVGGPDHAARLTELDALQGHIQRASVELRGVRDTWQEKDSQAGWSVAAEQLQDRIRLLELAGIDCGDCTVESVDRTFHYTYNYHFRQCAKVKCANLEAMRELKATLDRPYRERLLTRPARSLPHRKRAEGGGGEVRAGGAILGRSRRRGRGPGPAAALGRRGQSGALDRRGGGTGAKRSRAAGRRRDVNYDSDNTPRCHHAEEQACPGRTRVDRRPCRGSAGGHRRGVVAGAGRRATGRGRGHTGRPQPSGGSTGTRESAALAGGSG